MLELTPSLLEDLPKNGPTDPIEWYRWPVVGWVFRERINRGLRLLPPRRFEKALEIGFGAGAVQLALAPGVEELHGVDLDADPASVTRILARKKRTAALVRGDVRALPYADGLFDLAVSFSVFEHLHEYKKALVEVVRVLKPAGLFLLGMPRVDHLMSAGHRALGFKGFLEHHVTTPAMAAKSFSACGFEVEREGNLELPLRAPFGVRLYHNWLLRKRG